MKKSVLLMVTGLVFGMQNVEAKYKKPDDLILAEKRCDTAENAYTKANDELQAAKENLTAMQKKYPNTEGQPKNIKNDAKAVAAKTNETAKYNPNSKRSQ